ncbi:precorrin-2 dehydrogenase/sirohydrochlorin ferrochelatase family protein [Ethanoligenens sp.]|uniref:precorrin-2 dehydrogenase/sirohydrochlorin ferrochelatase family protein n=1 Tax=Ethanoligenens sp. TaxID=2099655 RepID=UPI0039EB1426
MEPYPMFPLFVPLAGKSVVFIGGGAITARRVEKLLAFGPRIQVVSPSLHPALHTQAQTGKLHWEPRAYRTGDLAGAALAVAATDDRAVNHAVAMEALERTIPISVADCHEESSFYFPAIMRGDGLVIGMVSETGEAHHAVRETAAEIRGILNATKDHSGRQPGKSSGCDSSTDCNGCHPQDRPRT